MIVSMIVAMDEKGGIGVRNQIPWHLSTDLKRFKKLTMGHHLIMGRKTYESIGRSLPGRVMIVVTRNRNYCPKDALIFHSIEEALAYVEGEGESEVFIIGGGEVFDQSLSKAVRIYLTLVHANVDADTYFPVLKETEWAETYSEEYPSSDKDQCRTTFKVLCRA